MTRISSDEHSIGIDVSNALKDTKLTIRVTAERAWLLRARIAAGLLMMRLGAFVMGASEVNVEVRDAKPNL